MPTKTKEPIRFFGLELTWLPEKGTVPDYKNPIVNPLAVCLGLSLAPIPTLYILHAARTNVFDPEMPQVIFQLSTEASFLDLGTAAAEETASSRSSALSAECDGGAKSKRIIGYDDARDGKGLEDANAVEDLENLVFHLPLSSLSQRAHEILLTLLANGELSLLHPTTNTFFASPANAPLDVISRINTNSFSIATNSVSPHDFVRDLATLTDYTTSQITGNSPILSLRVPHAVSGLAKRCGGCGRWEGMKRKMMAGAGECGYEYRRWRECKCGREWYCREKCRRRVFNELSNALKMGTEELRHEMRCEEWRIWREGKGLELETTMVAAQDREVEREYGDIDGEDGEENMMDGSGREEDGVTEEMETMNDGTINKFITAVDPSVSDLPAILEEDFPTDCSELTNPFMDPEPARPDSATVPEIAPSIHSSYHQPSENHINAAEAPPQQDDIERRFRESYERAQAEMGAVGFTLMPLPETRLTTEVVEAVIAMASVSKPMEAQRARESGGMHVRKGSIVLVEGAGVIGGDSAADAVDIREAGKINEPTRESGLAVGLKEGLDKVEVKVMKKCEELVAAFRELVSLGRK